MLPPPAPSDSTSIIGVDRGMSSTVGSEENGAAAPRIIAMSRLVPPMSVVTTRSSLSRRARWAAPRIATAGPELSVFSATVLATRALPPLEWTTSSGRS